MKCNHLKYHKKFSMKIRSFFNMLKEEAVNSEPETLECRVCHEKIKKGDIFVEIPGVRGYVCSRCESIALEEAVYQRPIASLDYEEE